MVSWWPGEGNANDIIGTNNGTFECTPGYSNGEVNQDFDCNGTDGDVKVPANANPAQERQMLLVCAAVPDLPQSIGQVDSSRSAPSNLDGRFAHKRVTGLGRIAPIK
jgi:hypothetical protein